MADLCGIVGKHARSVEGELHSHVTHPCVDLVTAGLRTVELGRSGALRMAVARIRSRLLRLGAAAVPAAPLSPLRAQPPSSATAVPAACICALSNSTAAISAEPGGGDDGTQVPTSRGAKVAHRREDATT